MGQIRPTKGDYNFDRDVVVCQICGMVMNNNDEFVLCPDCITPFHTSCWNNRGGCGNPKCESYVEKTEKNDTLQGRIVSAINEKAKKSLEAGEFENASALYKKALGYDLSNEEALIGTLLAEICVTSLENLFLLNIEFERFPAYEAIQNRLSNKTKSLLENEIALRKERKRLEEEKQEKERLERERQERERLESEKQEKERLERERLERERLESEKQEKKKLKREGRERKKQERLENKKKNSLKDKSSQDPKEKTRRIALISAILAILISVSIVIGVSLSMQGPSDDVPPIDYSYLDYEEVDGGIRIVGLTDKTLEEVIIPNEIGGLPVTVIGDDVFFGCTGLTSVTIPNSVTTIGSSAFSGCTGLTSIEIPNSVTTIGDAAFYNCTSLASIVIPTRVTTIGDAAFYDCTSLASIVIPTGVTTIGNSAFYDCTSLASIVIPTRVTTIGSFAFGGCTGLTSIEIPNSVTTIGDAAFYNCTSLASIVIPTGVTTIGSSAFEGCTGLTSIEIPNSVTAIGSYAFYNCTSLASIVIPTEVTTIGSSAFGGCTRLTSIEIPNSVTAIGSYAFSGCTGFTIYCEAESKPNGWDGIWNFSNCPVVWNCKEQNTSASDLKWEVTEDNEVIIVGVDDEATNVVIPAEIEGKPVTIIGEGAFAGCSGLT
ncbi:MAG: leucine-rich repeat protein, partial [Clostridia bacterium]|nr:leucine-rich repeat protein [Clostridia bacterium]